MVKKQGIDLSKIAQWAKIQAEISKIAVKRKSPENLSNMSKINHHFRLGHSNVDILKITPNAYAQATMGMRLNTFRAGLNMASKSKHLPVNSTTDFTQPDLYTSGVGETTISKTMARDAIRNRR